MFADDTELYKSDSPSEAFTLSRTIEACISDVNVLVVQNKLQLNDNKTEILLIGSAPGIDLPSSVRVGQSDIFSSAARNLGVIFDSELALKEHVNKLCQLAYLEIRRIGSIHQYLSVGATKTLVSSLVLSRLDYCNALFAGSTIHSKKRHVFYLGFHHLSLSLSLVLGPILFILYTQPLSDAISHHSVSHKRAFSHKMFADDTELYKSDSPSEAFTLSRTIEACISDMKVWVVQNKL